MDDQTYSLDLTSDQLSELQDLLALLSNSKSRDLQGRAEEMLALTMSSARVSA